MQMGGPSGGVELSAFLNRIACAADRDLENLAAQFRCLDRHGDGRLTKGEFFGIWSLDPMPGWRPATRPESPKALVRVLRGFAKESSLRGGAVHAWNFTTFGQPSFGRRSGRWYYELEIRKAEYPQVGWADRRFEFDDSTNDDGVGDDAFSWAVDGVRMKTWHDGEAPYHTTWPRPAVIGCALDFGTPRSMRFSVDGEWSETPEFEDFFFVGEIYPAASGIGVGAFRFSVHDCAYSPPDDTYHYFVGDGGGMEDGGRVCRPASP